MSLCRSCVQAFKLRFALRIEIRLLADTDYAHTKTVANIEVVKGSRVEHTAVVPDGYSV